MTRRGNGDGEAEGITLDRRDLLRGGAAVGTFALASRIETFRMVMEAQAQANEPRLQLGSDYFFDDDGSELVISHDTQGDILRYDPTADQITTLKPLTSVTTGDLDGSISNRGSSSDQPVTAFSGNTTTSSTEPSSPEEGDWWIDTS